MKVNIVSRKLIKPLTPTPPTLKKHKLSFLDELAPPFYVTVVLYYSASARKNTRAGGLEQSLAKTLSKFYTFAGRRTKNDRHFVDCNDSGAEYIEAEALDSTLSDFIAGLETNHGEMVGNQFHVEDGGPLLAIRHTKFDCGGAAIAVKVSHKVADAESVLSFLTMWSNEENHHGMPPGSIATTPPPDLEKGPSLLPTKSDGPNLI